MEDEPAAPEKKPLVEELDSGEDAGGCHREPTLIWTPEHIAGLDKEDLDLYFQFASSPCVLGGGCDVEQALDVLHQARGDLKEAMQRLLKMTTDAQQIWTLEEVHAFERLQMSYGKNFFLIGQDLKTKTVKECVRFFYTWKKSTFRNRYISPTTPKSVGSVHSVTSSISSTTSTTSATTIIPGTLSCAAAAAVTNSSAINLYASPQSNLTGTPSSSTSDESHDSGRGDSLLSSDEHKHYQLLTPPKQEKSPQQQQQQQPEEHEKKEEFPCKVCGRVFDRIKSRSAHMKRHKNEGYKR